MLIRVHVEPFIPSEFVPRKDVVSRKTSRKPFLQGLFIYMYMYKYNLAEWANV